MQAVRCTGRCSPSAAGPRARASEQPGRAVGEEASAQRAEPGPLSTIPRLGAEAGNSPEAPGWVPAQLQASGSPTRPSPLSNGAVWNGARLVLRSRASSVHAPVSRVPSAQECCPGSQSQQSICELVCIC